MMSPMNNKGLSRSPSQDVMGIFKSPRNNNQASYTTLPGTNEIGGGLKGSGSVSYLNPVIASARKESKLMSPFERSTLNNTEQLMSPRDYNMSVSGAHMTMDDRSNSPVNQAKLK